MPFALAAAIGVPSPEDGRDAAEQVRNAAEEADLAAWVAEPSDLMICGSQNTVPKLQHTNRKHTSVGSAISTPAVEEALPGRRCWRGSALRDILRRDQCRRERGLLRGAQPAGVGGSFRQTQRPRRCRDQHRGDAFGDEQRLPAARRPASPSSCMSVVAMGSRSARWRSAVVAIRIENASARRARGTQRLR